jgi:ribosomal-protein-alanine N-acetyltransferase
MSRIRAAAAGVEALDLLAALHAASFAEAWDRDSLARLLAAPGARALVAWDGEGGGARPLGLALLRVADDEGELLSLAVAPEARRRGAGRALLCECLAVAAALGACRMFLEVALDNRAARRLYQGFGFVEVGRRPRYYRPASDSAPDSGATALTLRLDLVGGERERDLNPCGT